PRTVITFFFFFSSRRRHTRFSRDWSSDVCSSDLPRWPHFQLPGRCGPATGLIHLPHYRHRRAAYFHQRTGETSGRPGFLKTPRQDRKSTRLNSSHVKISYAVFCLKKKKIARN